jgi:hypothetical protein
MLDRERQIRYLMRRFGLTREEAEGMLNLDVNGQQEPKPKASVIVEERKSGGDPDNAVFWGVALLAGFAGLALADWLLKKLSKKKRKEAEEWLV